MFLCFVRLERHQIVLFIISPHRILSNFVCFTLYSLEFFQTGKCKQRDSKFVLTVSYVFYILA